MNRRNINKLRTQVCKVEFAINNIEGVLGND